MCKTVVIKAVFWCAENGSHLYELLEAMQSQYCGHFATLQVRGTQQKIVCGTEHIEFVSSLNSKQSTEDDSLVLFTCKVFCRVAVFYPGTFWGGKFHPQESKISPRLSGFTVSYHFKIMFRKWINIWNTLQNRSCLNNKHVFGVGTFWHWETVIHSQLHINFRVLCLSSICKEMQNVVFLQGIVITFCPWTLLGAQLQTPIYPPTVPLYTQNSWCWHFGQLSSKLS